MTPEEFHASGHQLIDWIADYIETVDERRITPDIEPGDVRTMLPEHPPTATEPWSAVMRDLDDVILPTIVHWQHPNWHAYFPSNTSYPSILAELATAGLGVQGMSWVTSPACTEVETLMLDWMHELLGMPAKFHSTSERGGGVIHGSASEATLVAMLCARWRATGGAVNTNGDTSRLVAYATSQAHSSIEKGLRIAGIGTDHLRTVDHDSDFAMIPAALDAAIARDVADGLVPFFVCSTHGTTSSMAFDPTPEIARHVLDEARVVARRRRHERDCGFGTRVSLGQRRTRTRRQLLHQPPQVDGRELRLHAVLDRPTGSRCSEHSASCRSTCVRRRPRAAVRSTTAIGRCRSDDGSVR